MVMTMMKKRRTTKKKTTMRSQTPSTGLKIDRMVQQKGPYQLQKWIEIEQIKEVRSCPTAILGTNVGSSASRVDYDALDNARS